MTFKEEMGISWLKFLLFVISSMTIIITFIFLMFFSQQFIKLDDGLNLTDCQRKDYNLFKKTNPHNEKTYHIVLCGEKWTYIRKYEGKGTYTYLQKEK